MSDYAEMFLSGTDPLADTDSRIHSGIFVYEKYAEKKAN